MLFPKTPDGNFVENTSNNLSLSSDWQNQLEILITVGDDLFSRLDDSSRYKPHLHKYLNEARRVVSFYLGAMLLCINGIFIVAT